MNMQNKKMNFFSKSEFAVLAYLARHREELFGREIAKKARISIGAANNALNSLLKKGFINRTKRGANFFYSLEETQIIKNFRILLTLFEINPMVNGLKSICDKIVLYGSCASGDDVQESDVDLVILTRVREQVGLIIKDFSNRYDRKLQATIITSSEWLEYKAKNSSFYNNVNKGLVLWRRSNA